MKQLNYSKTNKTLLSYGGFKFYKTNEGKGFQEWHKRKCKEIDAVSSLLLNYYLKPMLVFSFNDITITDLKSNPKRLFNMIKKVYKTFPDHVLRIDAIYGSTYIHILTSDNDREIFTFTITETNTSYIKIRVCNVTQERLVANNPIYLGKSNVIPPLEDDLDYDSMTAFSNNNSDFWNKIGFIYGSLDKLYNNFSNAKTRDIDPYLLSFLPSMISENVKGDQTSFIFSISHQVNEKFVDKYGGKTVFGTQDIIDTYELPDCVLDPNWEQYPLIDLSNKEYKFIDRYVHEHTNLFDIIKDIDLNEYMSDPKYGNTYRFKNDKNGKEYLISYKIENNGIVFYIAMPMKDDTFIYLLKLTAGDIDKFNFNSAIEEIDISLLSKNVKMKYLPNYSDIMKELPSWVEDSKGTWAAILLFISMMLVMHDRPQRTKCLVAQVLKNENSKPNPNRSSSHKEKDYVIRRILKTSSDAKEFLKNKTGARGPVEYTTESWNRVGHWRTYKSGKKVWIGETECIRHKELSKKEIHIKL